MRQSYRRVFVAAAAAVLLAFSAIDLLPQSPRSARLGWLWAKSEKRTSAGGYLPPPWHFEGRAIYQLYPVKVQTAEKYIPKELNIVQLGGYTLGGWYLANYTDSPACDKPKFGELVAIAGLVWNPPSSCAWASHVYVGSKSAKIHGEKEVGLPENLGRFELRQPERKPGLLGRLFPPRPEVTLTCKGREVISMAVPKEREGWRAGVPVTMNMPSFSGYTRNKPGLLNYWLELKARISLVSPSCKTRVPEASPLKELLSNRPMICLDFEKLRMDVEPPKKFNPLKTFENVPFPFLQARRRDGIEEEERSRNRGGFLSSLLRRREPPVPEPAA